MADDKHHIQYVPEPSTISMPFVVWSALGSLLLVAAAIGGFYGLYRTVIPAVNHPAVTAFPQPRVDTRETEELHLLRAAQRKKLESWGWVDASHSLVKIPIERAMQLLAAKGEGAYAPMLQSQSALSAPTVAAERQTIQQQDTPDATPPGRTPEKPK